MVGIRPLPAILAGIAACFVALMPASPVSGAHAAQDRVALNFGWPDNLKAGVSYFYRQARTGGGKSRTLTVYGAYDAHAAPVGDGLRITTANNDVKVRLQGFPAGPQTKLRQFLAGAAASQPAFVIDRSGKFVRLEDLAAYRKKLENGLNAMFAQEPSELRAKISAAIAPALSEEQLQAGIVNQWNRIVGAWLEAELDVGDLYKLKFERPIPMLGNTPVRMVTDIKFVKRAPCTANGAKRKCVELYMRTVIDDDSVAKAIEKRTAQLAGAAGIAVTDFRTEETVRLLTEPRTLVPYRLHSVKKTATTVKANGNTQTVEQIDETKVAYKY